MNSKSKNIVVVFFFLVVLLLFAYFYLDRINIYKAFQVELNCKSDYKNCDEVNVYTTTALNRKIEINHYKNQFYVKSGYYRNIIIKGLNPENVDKIIITCNEHELIIEAKNIKSSGIVVLDSIHPQIFFEKLSVIFNLNLNYLIIFLTLCFVFVIIVYVKNLIFVKFLNKTIIIVLIAWALYWFILASLYSFPNAEDIALVLRAIDNGIINSTNALLIGYDARYTTNFFYGFNVFALCGLEYYKYVAIISLSLVLTASYLLFSSIFNKMLPRFIIIVISLSLILLHLIMIPSIVHHLYWMASSFVYLNFWLFIFAWLFFALLIIKTKKPVLLLFHKFLCSLFLVLSFGVNEMSIFINLFLILSFTYFSIKKHPNKKHFFYSLIILGIFNSLFLLLIPGTSDRMLYHGIERDACFYLNAINFSIKNYIEFLFSWSLKSPAVVAVILIITLLLNNKRVINSISLSLRELLAFTIGLFITMYLMTLTFYLPAGDSEGTPLRIYNCINLPYLFAVFILFPLIIIKSGLAKYLGVFEKSKSVFVLLFLICIYVFIQENNVNVIKSEYNSGQYMLHKKEMEERYKVIFNAQNLNRYRLAIVKELTAKPSTVFYGPDILNNRNPDLWNSSYEGYFELDEIRFNSDTIRKSQIIYNFLNE